MTVDHGLRRDLRGTATTQPVAALPLGHVQRGRVLVYGTVYLLCDRRSPDGASSQRSAMGRSYVGCISEASAEQDR